MVSRMPRTSESEALESSNLEGSNFELLLREVVELKTRYLILILTFRTSERQFWQVIFTQRRWVSMTKRM